MPSFLQIAQRRKFVRACACFRRQPHSGGATPPAKGYRSRPWWYTASLASGLYYFNYFMQQTLLGYTASVSVDWCVTASTDYEWCRIDNSNPGTVYYKPSGLSMYRGLNSSSGVYGGTDETKVTLCIVKCSVTDLYPAFMRAVVYAWNNNSRLFLMPYDSSVNLAAATWNNSTRYLSGPQVLTVSSGGFIANVSLVGMPIVGGKVAFMIGCLFDGSARMIGLDSDQAKPWLEP